MKCPKCDKPMNIQSFRHIEINRCTGCFGIFCSHDTIALVKDVWLAERVLDIGYESTGERFNTVDEILCPECNVQMDKITEAEQTHIWMEECPSCNKLFLDAGELSDLKFNTILDRLRDWKKGTRP